MTHVHPRAALAGAAAAALATSMLLAHGASAVEQPTCDGLVATMVGTEEGELILGTDGDDVIVALGGQDTVRAGAGNDVVCGGDGGDVLEGGPGADRLFGELEDTSHDDGPGLKGDTLRGGPGDDHLDGGDDPSGSPNRDQLSWDDSPRGVTVDLADGITGTATGFGRDTFVLTGGPVVRTSRFDDTVSGSPNRDRIRVLAGADTVYAGPGDDEVALDGGAGDRNSVDLVQTGPGGDLVISRAGRDRVFLGKGNDQFDGFGVEPVLVRGQRGHDYLHVHHLGPGSGGLVVRGDQGSNDLLLRADYPSGVKPRVTLDARAGRFAVRGGPRGVLADFDEVLLLGSAVWDYRGTDGDDQVSYPDFGGRLIARTGPGNDVLRGSAGRDLLDGGAGRDQADGGRGRDRCLHVEERISCEVTR